MPRSGVRVKSLYRGKRTVRVNATVYAAVCTRAAKYGMGSESCYRSVALLPGCSVLREP